MIKKIWTLLARLRAKDLILASARRLEKPAPSKLGKLTFCEKKRSAVWNGGVNYTYTVSYEDTKKTRLTV